MIAALLYIVLGGISLHIWEYNTELLMMLKIKIFSTQR